MCVGGGGGGGGGINEHVCRVISVCAYVGIIHVEHS